MRATLTSSAVVAWLDRAIVRVCLVGCGWAVLAGIAGYPWVLTPLGLAAGALILWQTRGPGEGCGDG